MLKFAANLSMMFQELAPAERFNAARAAGFRAVEYLRPYDVPIPDLKSWLKDAGLEMILINAPSGDADAGERGFGALPGREADFRRSLDEALEYASALSVGMVHVLAGTKPEDVDAATCEKTFAVNLRTGAELAKRHGVRINLEPLNTRDTPGYANTNTATTRRIIEACGSDNVFLQYDLYHLQIMQGDIVENARRNLDIIGHIQFSSVPGRNEPQYGELNMPLVFDSLDAMDYSGWLGCEYRPLHGTLEGLSWAAPYGIGIAAGS